MVILIFMPLTLDSGDMDSQSYELPLLPLKLMLPLWRKLRGRSVRPRLSLRLILTICHMDFIAHMSTPPLLLSLLSRRSKLRHLLSLMPPTMFSHTPMDIMDILMFSQSLLKLRLMPRLMPRLLRLRERSVRLRLTLRLIPTIGHMDSTVP